MAIIHGNAPDSDPVAAVVRLVVKLTDRGLKFAPGLHPNGDPSVLSVLRRVAPAAEFKPYFSEHEQLRAASLPPFNRYLSVDFADRESADLLARSLQGLPEVEEAYVEAEFLLRPES